MQLNKGKNNRFRIEPKHGHSDAYEKVFERIKNDLDLSVDAMPYDLIFYVKDMDTCYAQNKIDDYNKRKDRLLKHKNAQGRLYIIESRPCIEFWFLLHFLKTDGLLSKCEAAEKQLQKYLKDYEKTEDYARKLYDLLSPKLEIALRNAADLNSKPRAANEHFSYSQINELYKTLKDLK
ncbi:MAG: RloB domain-containing protein [Candidatus Cloacimonadaceae bacterium]